MNFRFGRVAVPLLYFLALARGTLFGLPFRFVLHCLLFEMVERSADRDHHIFGLSQADQRAISRVDGDLGLMAVLFDAEDGLGFEAITKNLADFCETGFYFFADGGGYFIMSAGVFHVHERPSLDSCET